MLYLIQSTLYTALLYAVYVLFLRDTAAHRASRYYLLGTAIAAIVLPVIRIPGFSSILPGELTTLYQSLPEIIILPGSSISQGPSVSYVISILYLSSVLLSGVALSIRYTKAYRHISKLPYQLTSQKIKLIKDSGYGPGSFGNYVLFPGKEVNPDILQHETAHVRLKHSRDMLLLQILRCVFWPNLMLYVI